MDHDTTVICIGAVLWDVVGHASIPLGERPDVPGRIIRRPGGVALNIAMGLKAVGLTPLLLSAVSTDPAGNELVAACTAMGLDTTHLLRDPALPTDAYMAIEDRGRLVAAIADALSLEAAGDRILEPLTAGALGSAATPYRGRIALDGNLTPELMSEIATHPAFAEADLRLAPASPGKAERLLPFLDHPRATLYVNLQEAGLLSGEPADDAATAAARLGARGAGRVLVTDGAGPAADATADGVIEATPPQVKAKQITGAGDAFMAAHIAAEVQGMARAEALNHALQAAANYVSGKDPA